MIQMTMGKDQRQQIAPPLQAFDPRVERSVIGMAIQREPQVEQNARTMRFQLDAASADLLGSPMYLDPHTTPPKDATGSTEAGTINFI